MAKSKCATNLPACAPAIMLRLIAAVEGTTQQQVVHNLTRDYWAMYYADGPMASVLAERIAEEDSSEAEAALS